MKLDLLNLTLALNVRALEDLSETSEATRLKNCLFGLSTFSPPSELLPPKICDHEGKVILSNSRFHKMIGIGLDDE